MSELVPGQLIAGKYRVERLIGQGGMARVISAVHTELDQRVAIKMLLPELAGHAQTVARFLREAKAAVKIRGDHVARVIDVGRLEHGAPYMVLEYLEGTDLGCWVEENGPMAVTDAVDAVIQACDAIAQAHALGIVHRDLKPSNLFFTLRNDGKRTVKVIDFGISKQLATDALPSMTATSEVFGSPQYMAPEQIRASKDVDGRTDIWALGIVLYELLTGRPPFVAESVLLLGSVILAEEPPPLGSFRADVPAQVEAALMKCLRKKPDDRFASAVDFAEALLPFASDDVKRLVGSMPRIPVAQAARIGSSPDLTSSGSLVPPSRASSARVVVGHDKSGSDTLGAAATHANTGDLPPKRALSAPLVVGLAAAGVTLVVGTAALFVVLRGPNASENGMPPPAASVVPIATTVASAPVASVATSGSPAPAPTEIASAVPAVAPSSSTAVGPRSTGTKVVASPPGTNVRGRPPAISTTSPVATVAAPASTPAPVPTTTGPAPATTPASVPTVVRDRHGGN